MHAFNLGYNTFMGDKVKTFIKDTFEEGIEQITDSKQKPQSQQQNQQQSQQKKTTAGLSDQASPGKIFADMLKQGGINTDKSLTTPEELDKMKEGDRKNAEEEIREKQEELGIKTSKPQQPRGNLEVINPPKPKQQEEAPYISGKPGYDPEKRAKEKKKKEKLPELPMPKGKLPRGSFLSALERKKHGAEVKGGRE